MFLDKAKIIISATRRSKNIKILLCLSGPVRKSLTMDARKSAIFAFQFVKPILQTITYLIQ